MMAATQRPRWKAIASTVAVFVPVASTVAFLMLILAFFVLRIPDAWSNPALTKLLIVVQQSATMTLMMALPCAVVAGIVLAIMAHVLRFQSIWAALFVGTVMFALALPIFGQAILDLPSLWGTGVVLFSFIPTIAAWFALHRNGLLK